jgi:hypothetical protein
MDHPTGSKGGSAQASMRRRSGAISVPSHPSSRKISGPKHQHSGLNTYLEDVDGMNALPNITLVYEHGRYLHTPPQIDSRHKRGGPERSTSYNPAHRERMISLTEPESIMCDMPAVSASHESRTKIALHAVTPHFTSPDKDKYYPSSSGTNTSLSLPHRQASHISSSLKRNFFTVGSLKTDAILTTKFPISRTVKKLAVQQSADETGLGIEFLDRWTTHKWWLFLSTLTLFCYGTAASVYALLTWFKSKPPILHIFQGKDPLMHIISLGRSRSDVYR